MVRFAALAGVGVLVLVLNIAVSVLYMVVYSHMVNPGHTEEFYKEHVQRAAPYSSIIAGVPLMFLAGVWVSGWWGGQLGVKGVLAVWLTYAVIDVAVMLAAGMTAKMAVLVLVSLVTKLGAGYLGTLAAGDGASVTGVGGPG